MRELKEKWIKEFVAPGIEVVHNGKPIRPNVRVNIAIGKIVTINEASGKNNLKVVLKVPGAKYDFSGFINDNTPVSKLLREAKEKELPICVRFERKRKKEADPTKDIMELTENTSIAAKNVIWVVSGVYNFTNSSWIMSDNPVSNPAEDPEYVKKDIEAAAYSTENFFEGNAPKLKTSDLEWKENHLISMFTYASEQNKENESGFTQSELEILAVFMLKAVDHLQMKMKNIPAPNYNDYSHTKARGMLFSWMRVNPLNKEILHTKGEFNKWISRFIEENVALVAWAKKTVNAE